MAELPHVLAQRDRRFNYKNGEEKQQKYADKNNKSNSNKFLLTEEEKLEDPKKKIIKRINETNETISKEERNIAASITRTIRTGKGDAD